MGGSQPAPKSATGMTELASGILPVPDLPLKLSAIVLPGSKSAARVALALEITVPRLQVEERDGRVRDTLKYELLVVDEKKKRVRSLGGREGLLTLSATALGRTPPDDVKYQVAETVDLAPGQYEVRWSATSTKLGTGGSVYLPLTVPDFRGDGPVLGNVVVGYAEGGRVPRAPVTERLVQRGGRVMTPPVDRKPDLPVAPTLDREFTSADTLRVYAEGTVGGAARPMVGVDVVDRAGRVVRSPSASFAVGETVKALVDLPLAGLSGGPYVLRVTLGSGGRSATREIGFSVR
jgi:hypothetical protein